MKLPWKKKAETEPSESEPEPYTSDDIDIDDELDPEFDIDEELEDLEEDDHGAIENLDVEGHWNRKFIDFENYMGKGGQRAIVRGRKGVKGSPDEITLTDVCARAEQDILGIKLGMLDMKEAQTEGRRLMNEFQALKQAIGSRQYAKLIVALRYSCTHEAKIGFHEPSFSEWDLPIEEWVDEEYLRRLQGIDVASGDWKKGVDK